MNCSARQAGKDNIEGIWKGTSLCQVKSSPCHDENVVYHISRATNGKTYTIQMNKIVNGAEEEMGASDAVYDEPNTLSPVPRKTGKVALVFGCLKSMANKCMEHSRLMRKPYTGSLR